MKRKTQIFEQLIFHNHSIAINVDDGEDGFFWGVVFPEGVLDCEFADKFAWAAKEKDLLQKV